MNKLGTYYIRIRGRLDPKWADWFERMAITTDGDGESVLAGPVVDQAALYGLLDKIRDLGLELISVNRDAPGEEREGHDGSR